MKSEISVFRGVFSMKSWDREEVRFVEVGFED